jgi:plasmid stabilization system protein ParE
VSLSAAFTRFAKHECGSLRYTRLSRRLWRIASENPEMARRVVARIRAAVARLSVTPGIGRPGRWEEPESLPSSVHPTSYFNRVAGDALQIVTVLHGTQIWPNQLP